MDDNNEDTQGGILENAEFYDSFSLEVHGIGHRHDESTCTDKTCGRCGKSTTGPALDGKLRAGDVHADESHPSAEAKSLAPFNPEIVAGGERAIHAIEESMERDPRTHEEWERMQSEAPAGFTPGGGGGSSGGAPMADQIRGKTSIAACQYCHLQHKRGAACPSLMEEPRPELVGARVSKRVKTFIDKEAGATAGVIVETSVAFMMRMGWTVSMMQAFLDAQIADAEKENAA